MILLFAFQNPTKGKKANKTIYDSAFVVGDIIKIPQVIFTLSKAEHYGPSRYSIDDSLEITGNFLLKHPNLTVEYCNHTDSRGSEQANQKLTEVRSKACIDYLVEMKKIDPSKIISKGYGESRLLISDAELLKAKTMQEKEKLHQINRRQELIVIKVN